MHILDFNVLCSALWLIYEGLFEDVILKKVLLQCIDIGIAVLVASAFDLNIILVEPHR